MLGIAESGVGTVVGSYTVVSVVDIGACLVVSLDTVGRVSDMAHTARQVQGLVDTAVSLAWAVDRRVQTVCNRPRVRLDTAVS